MEKAGLAFRACSNGPTLPGQLSLLLFPYPHPLLQVCLSPSYPISMPSLFVDFVHLSEFPGKPGMQSWVCIVRIPDFHAVNGLLACHLKCMHGENPFSITLVLSFRSLSWFVIHLQLAVSPTLHFIFFCLLVAANL